MKLVGAVGLAAAIVGSGVQHARHRHARLSCYHAPVLKFLSRLDGLTTSCGKLSCCVLAVEKSCC